ncbi:MAG: hypothetical protein E4G94_11335 [ANME-2 cluster archaeon]|nr:MAG: hypothetical protein E4G94_11335 [ANME-2 cluster archaeon]
MDTTENNFDMDEYIPQAEREHMLFELHRYLAWVGESIPEMITIDDKDIQLHELVWKLIQKKRLTESEKKCVKWLINKLETIEQIDEEKIEKAHLTRAQAALIQDEAAGLLRAIMDLRDLEEGKIRKADLKKLNISNKVEDARRWVKYMKQMRE